MRRSLLAEIALFGVFFQSFHMAAQALNLLSQGGEFLGLAEERLVELLEVVLEMRQQRFHGGESVFTHSVLPGEVGGRGSGL